MASSLDQRRDAELHLLHRVEALVSELVRDEEPRDRRVLGLRRDDRRALVAGGGRAAAVCAIIFDARFTW
jgi:hypothetical protein